jgi:hypothetical protein
VQEVVLSPFDGRRVSVGMTDIAHELACQVVERGEDPAGDQLAFDAAESRLHRARA